MTRLTCHSTALALLLGLGAHGCGGRDDGLFSSGGRSRQLPTGTLSDGAMPMDDDTNNGDGDGDGDEPGGSSMDASMDGGNPLTMIGDASLRLPDGTIVLPDGAILLPDGQVLDLEAAIARFEPEIDVTSCAISEIDTWEDSVEFGDEAGFTLVAGVAGGFGLAYRAITTGSCSANIMVADLPSTGAFPTPTPMLDDCKALRDLSLMAAPDGWHVAWIDNAALTAELQTTKLGADLKPPNPIRTTITDSLPELELKPVLADMAGRPLLVWIAHDVDTDEYGIIARFLDDADAESFPIVPMGMALAPRALAVSQIADGLAGVVAWVGPLDNAGVWIQPLDANGRPRDEPRKLTERVGASSSVSVANRLDGGGIVYSVAIDNIPQVRYFRLDARGDPVADERLLVSSPQRAQDASITALGTGYAVAFRELPSTGSPNPQVRLVFITREGNVPRDPGGRLLSLDIGPSTVSTGRTYISVSVDGQLMVAWIDADPGAGTNLLKVVRRRLDCAPEI